MSLSVKVEIPSKLIPVFDGPADVRGSYGGRGSAKTRTFAKMSAVKGYILSKAGTSGIILCGRQFMNSLADSSFDEVKEAILSEPWLAQHYDIGEKYIRTRDGRINYSFAGLDRNIESVKSKARILLCWVDEAEAVSEHAWMTLIPTIREEGSELWVTWNPKRKGSATDKRFRNTDDPLIKIVEMNWRDNEKFPTKLERERQRDLKQRPEQYPHIWEGDYASVVEGAYFASSLLLAKEEGRIGKVGPDPLMTYRLFADLGGTGAKADAFVFWVVQFVGREVRLLDYYETVGQPISAHLEWMREKRLSPRNSTLYLPHDGATQDRIYDVSFASAFNSAGFEVEVIPNQGKGAAKSRIESARRIFPLCWFHEERTQAGREALGWYHEKRDEERGVGLGPEHDWASHGSDAFGLMCLVAEKHFKDQQYYEPDEGEQPDDTRSVVGGY